ncbi:MAG: leucyl aminopeptidase family protein [Hyphomicrobium sp.]
MIQALDTHTAPQLRSARSVFATEDDGKQIPIHLVYEDGSPDLGLSSSEKRWLETLKFKGKAKSHVLLSKSDGSLSSVLLGGGNGEKGEPCGASDLLLGLLHKVLFPSTYHLGQGFRRSDFAYLSWGLGSYQFKYFKRTNDKGSELSDCAKILLPQGTDRLKIQNTVEAIWFARDLINMPASDFGPSELEAAVRKVGALYGAQVRSIVGEELLSNKFNMIYAVGRGSPRQPRLIELSWKKDNSVSSAPKITLIGKGITFDTGGLDIKPASAMLLMKKDMGGAAVALAIAHMIMAQQLDVDLKLLIPSAENSVSGDAFRPGDILTSRNGKTIEIGNTDAEGRLILADALEYADKDSPDTLFIFATLTGAARTALGPDIPALFCNDDQLAARLVETGLLIGDPVWRLPLWDGYERHLESDIADCNNVWESPFAGSITAALFLKKFLRKTKRFAHFDLYGWRPANGPLGPKGAEAQTARTVMEVLRQESLIN